MTALLTALGLPVALWLHTGAASAGEGATPAPVRASAPAAPVALTPLVVQPFRLRTPYRYDWSADHPMVSEGLLVVLRSPAAAPRDVDEPLLYAGAVPMERLSWSPTDTAVVAIIPGPLAHRPLSETLLYWGAPALAEQLDAPSGAAELRRALAAGVRPASPAALSKVTAPQVQVESAEALLCLAADLVSAWAPADAARAAGWRAAPACARAEAP